MTVVVNQALLLLQIEADPVMEAGDLALFDFTYSKESTVGDLASYPTLWVPFLPSHPK